MIDERTRYILRRYVAENPYIPHIPFPNQLAFLALPHREALFGGAAGGGKSDALLMAALMFVEVPGYNALLLRKTYTDLALPEAIMSRSHEWLADTDATWNGAEYRWTFPSGATLSFGYLNHDSDKYRYQSSAYAFIGWDELTQWPSEPYLYMFSRLRRLTSVDFPVRMRGATNPGGVGHHWVYERFVVDSGQPFIPSRLSDNPHINREAYRRTLSELDETTRRQLEDGEWVLDPHGKPFNRAWYRDSNRYVPAAELGKDPPRAGRYISLDTALEVKERSDWTAWTVADVMGDYSLRVREVGRAKLTFPELVDHIASLARQWDYDHKLNGVLIEGAASGKPAIQSLRQGVDSKLAGLIVEVTPRGSKVERASQAAIWCKRGRVHLPVPRDEWLADFERELFTFPDVDHDDRVDSFTQLVVYLENYLAAGWRGAKLRRGTPDRERGRVARALGRT